jgi:hypothetical protein
VQRVELHGFEVGFDLVQLAAAIVSIDPRQ